jgi:glycosyltransferase involved in cell wall biosynthesis
MNIALVINNLCTGGAERLVIDLANSLSKKNCNLKIITLEDKIEFNLDLNPNIKISSLSCSRFSPKVIFKLYNEIKDYDIIHVHLFPSLYWVALLNIILKKSIFMTEHNSTNRRRNISIFKFLDKFIYKQYTNIISISKEVEKNLLTHLKEKKSEKYKIIYNGIDIEKFSMANKLEKRIVDNDYPVLCMIASFTDQKDQDTIVRALELVNKKVNMIFIGDGYRKEHVVKMTRKLNTKHEYFFLGVRNDVPQILKEVDIMIHSTKWEGFGLVAVEAMASGLPIIYSDVPGLKEVMGNVGFPFPVGNEVELARIIEEVLENDNIKKKQREIGKMRANKFSIDRMACEYYELYLSAIKQCNLFI